MLLARPPRLRFARLRLASLLEIFEIPDTDALVVAAADEPLAVGSERDTGNRPRVPDKSADLLAGAHVPKLDRAVLTGRSQERPFGEKATAMM